MQAAALADGVGMSIVSAFRSIERQAEIVRAKLARGLALEEILCVSAPPGVQRASTPGVAVDPERRGRQKPSSRSSGTPRHFAGCARTPGGSVSSSPFRRIIPTVAPSEPGTGATKPAEVRGQERRPAKVSPQCRHVPVDLRGPGPGRYRPAGRQLAQAAGLALTAISGPWSRLSLLALGRGENQPGPRLGPMGLRPPLCRRVLH